MATNTFLGVLRSSGGDTTKRAYAGSAVLTATFHIPDPTLASTTAVRKSASDSSAVILPANAIVTEIIANAAATGGTNPTFDMGWIGLNDTSAFDVDDLLNEGDADAGKQVFTIATATAGAKLGVSPMSTVQPVKITGGVGASAATGGSITGFLRYHISDNGAYDR